MKEKATHTASVRDLTEQKVPGAFTISSGVRTNVTLESAQLDQREFWRIIGKNYSEKDLETTKGFLIKSNARAFETAGAKLNMLENISKYGWKYDYVKEREQIVKAMTVEQIKRLVAEISRSRIK